MKILSRPVILLIAVWCVVVMLVPAAMAADQGRGFQQQAGPGTMPGGQGNENQIQAPPSGGPGGSGQQGTQDNGNRQQMQEQPSGTMNGNMTAPAGHGNMNGNGNMTRPDFGNMTAPAWNDNMNGNGNMTPPDFGNTTPLGFGNQTLREMRGGHGLAGNLTDQGSLPDNQSAMNPADRPIDNGQGNQQKDRTGTQATSQVQQQSVEKQINSIISQLQSLLSGKK